MGASFAIAALSECLVKWGAEYELIFSQAACNASSCRQDTHGTALAAIIVWFTGGRGHGEFTQMKRTLVAREGQFLSLFTISRPERGGGIDHALDQLIEFSPEKLACDWTSLTCGDECSRFRRPPRIPCDRHTDLARGDCQALNCWTFYIPMWACWWLLFAHGHSTISTRIRILFTHMRKLHKW